MLVLQTLGGYINLLVGITNKSALPTDRDKNPFFVGNTNLLKDSSRASKNLPQQNGDLGGCLFKLNIFSL